MTVLRSGISNIEPAEISRVQNHFVLQSFRRGHRQQHLMHCLAFKLTHIRNCDGTGTAGSIRLPVRIGHHQGAPGSPRPWLALRTPSCPQVSTRAGCSGDTRERVAVVTRAARQHMYLELAQAPAPVHQMQTVSVGLPSSSFSKRLPSTHHRGEETALWASWVLGQSPTVTHPQCCECSRSGCRDQRARWPVPPRVTREGIRVEMTPELQTTCRGRQRAQRVPNVSRETAGTSDDIGLKASQAAVCETLQTQTRPRQHQTWTEKGALPRSQGRPAAEAEPFGPTTDSGAA